MVTRIKNKKKHIIYLLKQLALISLLSGTVIAQIPKDSLGKARANKNQIGLFFSVSKIYSTNDPNTHIINYRPGVNFDFVLNKSLAFSTGLLLNCTSSSYTESQYSKHKYLNFGIQIPALLNYRLSDKSVSPFLNFGLIIANRTFNREVYDFNYGNKSYHSVNTSSGAGYLRDYFLNFRFGFGIDARFNGYNIKFFPYYEPSVNYNKNYLASKVHVSQFLGLGVNFSIFKK